MSYRLLITYLMSYRLLLCKVHPGGWTKNLAIQVIKNQRQRTERERQTCSTPFPASSISLSLHIYIPGTTSC
jgi:hypothetical protein